MIQILRRAASAVVNAAANKIIIFFDQDNKVKTKDQNGNVKTFVVEDSGGVSSAKPYLLYMAMATQTGTSAPVVTVLKNELGGNISYAYTSVGTFTATATGLLNPTTAIQIGSGHNPVNSSDVPSIGHKGQTNDGFIITTGDALNQGLTNGILDKTLIIIYKFQ